MKQTAFIIACFILFTTFLNGQCPDRDILWRRIIYVRDSSKLSPKEQLPELLGYLGKMNTCAYRNDTTHVTLLLAIEDAYFQQAEYLKALQYRREAINIIEKNAGNPSIIPQKLPGNYYWLSVIYDSLNDVSEKMRALDSCADIAIRLNYISRASLLALYTRVEYFYDIGDYYRCIDYATRCEKMGREFARSKDILERNDGISYASSSLHWKVNALLRLGKHEEADKLLSNKLNEYNKTGLNNYLGILYSELADVQIQKGDYTKAVSFLEQALFLYNKSKNYLQCKQILNQLGYEIYFKQFKDYNKAISIYRKALRYINKEKSKQLSDVFESINIFTNIANSYSRIGVPDSAFKYFQLAFDQISPGSNEIHIQRSPPAELIRFKKIYYLTDLLISKGDVYRQQYLSDRQQRHLNEAVAIYKVADQLLDRIKVMQFDLQSKLFWRSDSRRLYENAIEACYLQGNITDAFYFFEKSRAVLLNDQLNENRFVAEKDIMKQTEVRKKIGQLQIELGKTEVTSVRVSELQSMLFEKKKELDRLQQVIKMNSPLYYQSFLDTTFISIPDIKRTVLNDHEGLLEIFAGDSAVYALVLTAEGSHLERIDRISFEQLSGRFTDYVSNFNLMNRNNEDFRRVSSDLYQLIFRNINLPAGRLIISPDGRYFPFEALITNKTGQPLRWFIEDYAVSYAYSARFLMNNFNAGQTSGGNFFGMAPVNYPSVFALAALPGSDQSLSKIAAHFSNAVSRTRLDATRRNFLKQFSNFRVIQLYTHAADSSMNNEPVIYFADSALYLSDLTNEYKPLTQLIVLSACETGAGAIYRGEGVFSFNRGFASLGIPAAITNLWSVDNSTTYQLTEHFYKWLSSGLSTDVALQKAKLEFLQTSSKEKSLPCYWAGPVLVGKTDMIELSKPNSWKWLAVFAGLAIIVVWTIRKWVISKKSISEKGKEITSE